MRQASKKEKLTVITCFHKPFKPDFVLKLNHVISLSFQDRELLVLCFTDRMLQATPSSGTRSFPSYHTTPIHLSCVTDCFHSAACNNARN